MRLFCYFKGFGLDIESFSRCHFSLETYVKRCFFAFDTLFFLKVEVFLEKVPRFCKLLCFLLGEITILVS